MINTKNNRKKRNIDVVEEMKDVASKKRVNCSQKSFKKKKMRFTKPTLLVDEADLETIDYNGEPNEDIFANESVLAAAN